MPRGGPEYQNWGEPTVRFPLYDLGELAARLGSPASLDRRGEIIALTAFTPSDFMGAGVLAGANPTSALDRTRSLIGGYSLRLATSAPGVESAAWYAQVGLPLRYRSGLEVLCQTSIGGGHINFAVGAVQDNVAYQAQVRYDQNDQTWEYLNFMGAWLNTGIVAPLHISVYVWHQVKLVVDLETLQYVYLLINGQEYSLAGLYLPLMAMVVPDYMVWGVIMESTAVNPGTVWLDRAIVTQSEPAI